MREQAQAQGYLSGVAAGVMLAGFPGLGSRSAVFLIHEKHRQARGAMEGTAPGVYRSETGCYHTESVNVL